jgi:hypothetical protein
MGDELAPGMPQDGGDARSRFGSLTRVRLPKLRLPPLGHLRSRIRPPSWPPSPFVAALAVLAIAVMFLAGLTYYGASTFSARAADRRAADEAQSLAHLGSRLATGDAFDGYIQILRYAEDPVLNDRNSSETDRLNAMQRLLYINVNKFQSLSIVNRAGVVLASTDPNIQDINTSGALLETRSTLGPANSDITMPRPGERGYLDYTAPLRDPDGSVWGILLGRADPARIFRGTLDARADGSQTVIINSQGQFAAGVPDELLRLPWQGRPMDNGAVFARIAGTDSICGLAAIGQGTQMDRGLNVAACLPASIIQADREWATGKQLIITIAGAVLVIVVGALLLWYLLRIAPAYAAPAATPALAATHEPAPAEPPSTPIEIIAADPPPGPADIAPPVPVADVDALALIDAFERRGARIAAAIRERVQARLLTASAQADEAFRIVSADEELARTLHQRAIGELEDVRESELRHLAHELYPAIIRLGLPGALQSLRKELADIITVRLDVDPAADSVANTRARPSMSREARLVVYRLVRAATEVAAHAGASACDVSIRRRDAWLSIVIKAELPTDEAADDAPLMASAIAVEAHGGTIETSQDGATYAVRVELPAPPTPPSDDDEADGNTELDGSLEDEAATHGDEVGLPPVVVRSVTSPLAALDEDNDDSDPGLDEGVAALDTPSGTGAGDDGLVARLEAIRERLFGRLVVGLETSVVQPEPPAAVLDALTEFVRLALDVLASADARTAGVAVAHSGERTVARIEATGVDALGPDAFGPAQDVVRGAGGRVSFTSDERGLTIAADIDRGRRESEDEAA